MTRTGAGFLVEGVLRVELGLFLRGAGIETGPGGGIKGAGGAGLSVKGSSKSPSGTLNSKRNASTLS